VEGRYEHREAHFGFPNYGGSIAQSVYYMDSEFCDETDEEARGGWQARDLDEDGKMERCPSPFILMVNRGKCSFVQKVSL